MNLLSIDAETNGLLGQPFAVGAVKTTDQDDGPSSVDDYYTAHGLSVGKAFSQMSAHHPLYDARAAEVCARHILDSGP